MKASASDAGYSVGILLVRDSYDSCHLELTSCSLIERRIIQEVSASKRDEYNNES